MCTIYKEDYLDILEMYAFLFTIVCIHWAKTVHMAGCINQTDESDFLASMWHRDLWDMIKQDFPIDKDTEISGAQKWQKTDTPADIP